ncbi:MAG: hypothetical protein H6694_01845 [Candidatus Latescibacteria bacterium]|nr:hypothetical protein [Candidatus Latescibacterota bacterium]
MLRRIVGMVLLLSVSLLLSCAAGPNELRQTPEETGEVAGFWLGLWQGIILPFAFIVSLFNDGVSVYDAHNNGHLYDLGFVLGAMLILGSGGKSTRRRKQKD